MSVLTHAYNPCMASLGPICSSCESLGAIGEAFMEGHIYKGMEGT